jgi:FMN phosphatase YigB (HAD superfamily)
MLLSAPELTRIKPAMSCHQDIVYPAAIIWDLDRTLYPFDNRFKAANQQAALKVIRALEIEITPAARRHIAAASYPMQAMGWLGREYQLDMDKLFYDYFSHLDESFLRPNKAFLAAATALSANVKFGLLSHCNNSWAQRALVQLGLNEMILPAHRLTIEEMQTGGKDQTAAALLSLFNRMGVMAEECMVADDKDKNLAVAAEIGCTTVLITSYDPDPNIRIKNAQHIYGYCHEFLLDVKRNGRQLQSGACKYG